MVRADGFGRPRSWRPTKLLELSWANVSHGADGLRGRLMRPHLPYWEASGPGARVASANFAGRGWQALRGNGAPCCDLHFQLFVVGHNSDAFSPTERRVAAFHTPCILPPSWLLPTTSHHVPHLRTLRQHPLRPTTGLSSASVARNRCPSPLCLSPRRNQL